MRQLTSRLEQACHRAINRLRVDVGVVALDAPGLLQRTHTLANASADSYSRHADRPRDSLLERIDARLR